MIDTIIFDLDGTFYENDLDMSNYYHLAKDFLIVKFDLSENEAENLLKQYNVFQKFSENSGSVTTMMLKLGIDREEWNTYRNNNFNLKVFDNRNFVNPNFLLYLEKQYKLFLLTYNTASTTEKILKSIGISKDLFIDIFTSDSALWQNTSFSKKEAFVYISENFNIPFEKMLSVGDRHEVDILPLLELGGSGVLVKNPKEIENVLRKKLE